MSQPRSTQNELNNKMDFFPPTKHVGGVNSFLVPDKCTEGWQKFGVYIGERQGLPHSFRDKQGGILFNSGTDVRVHPLCWEAGAAGSSESSLPMPGAASQLRGRVAGVETRENQDEDQKPFQTFPIAWWLLESCVLATLRL